MENIKLCLMNFVSLFKEDKFSNAIAAITGSAGVFITYLIGDIDMGIRTLIIFMLIDYILGIMCGKANENISSKTAFKGILKKIAIWSLVTVSNMIDKNIGANGMLRNLVIFFYIGQDGISILENAALLGVPIPEKLKDSLIQLKDGGKKNFSNDKE